MRLIGLSWNGFLSSVSVGGTGVLNEFVHHRIIYADILAPFESVKVSFHCVTCRSVLLEPQTVSEGSASSLKRTGSKE